MISMSVVDSHSMRRPGARSARRLSGARREVDEPLSGLPAPLVLVVAAVVRRAARVRRFVLT